MDRANRVGVYLSNYYQKVFDGLEHPPRYNALRVLRYVNKVHEQQDAQAGYPNRVLAASPPKPAKSIWRFGHKARNDTPRPVPLAVDEDNPEILPNWRYTQEEYRSFAESHGVVEPFVPRSPISFNPAPSITSDPRSDGSMPLSRTTSIDTGPSGHRSQHSLASIAPSIPFSDRFASPVDRRPDSRRQTVPVARGENPPARASTVSPESMLESYPLTRNLASTKGRPSTPASDYRRSFHLKGLFVGGRTHRAYAEGASEELHFLEETLAKEHAIRERFRLTEKTVVEIQLETKAKTVEGTAYRGKNEWVKASSLADSSFLVSVQDQVGKLLSVPVTDDILSSFGDAIDRQRQIAHTSTEIDLPGFDRASDHEQWDIVHPLRPDSISSASPRRLSLRHTRSPTEKRPHRLSILLPLPSTTQPRRYMVAPDSSDRINPILYLEHVQEHARSRIVTLGKARLNLLSSLEHILTQSMSLEQTRQTVNIHLTQELEAINAERNVLNSLENDKNQRSAYAVLFLDSVIVTIISPLLFLFSMSNELWARLRGKHPTRPADNSFETYGTSSGLRPVANGGMHSRHTSLERNGQQDETVELLRQKWRPRGITPGWALVAFAVVFGLGLWLYYK